MYTELFSQHSVSETIWIASWNYINVVGNRDVCIQDEY